ncbi:MAG: hypothetical protein OXU45_03510 [Candidatus Melainabacteria bacterium]|nr:hypothetical protein [Candidatus Melainabacteria bacterium]
MKAKAADRLPAELANVMRKSRSEYSATENPKIKADTKPKAKGLASARNFGPQNNKPANGQKFNEANA